MPEADVRVGHGQMRERDLEQLMVDFYHRRFNLLVCTTIIESGIDVPTANTIMIDRADRLGLAQLHQLRGRVGRSHHRAYAYLLTPPRKALSLDAVKRLEAIESLEDLGAGFVLATHDLEIRGAGELLGESQSGELTEIGLTHVPRPARAGGQGAQGRPRARCSTVRWPPPPRWSCACPRCCPRVTWPTCRCAWRCTSAWRPRRTMPAIDALTEEIVDRFGPLPPPATNLLRVARLKLAARAIGIRRLDLGAAGWLRVVRGAEPGRPARGHTAGAASRPRLPARRRAQAAHIGRDRRRRRALRVRREVPEASSSGTATATRRKTTIANRYTSRPMTTSGRFRHFIAALAFALVSVSASLPVALAQTANPTVYTVEVIVFRNLSGAGGPEDWSAKPVARGPDTPDAPVTGQFVQAIPAAQFQLNDIAGKLQNTTNYQPIAHFAWQQTASSWGSRAGFTVAKLAGNVPGLSGIIYLESGTYLHLGMSLNYQTSNAARGAWRRARHGVHAQRIAARQVRTSATTTITRPSG